MHGAVGDAAWQEGYLTALEEISRLLDRLPLASDDDRLLLQGELLRRRLQAREEARGRETPALLDAFA